MERLSIFFHWLSHPFRCVARAFTALINMTQTQIRALFSLGMLGGIISLSFQNIGLIAMVRATLNDAAPGSLFGAMALNQQWWNNAIMAGFGAILGLVVFDMAVNAGPTTAARLLQDVVGAARDGVIGPLTIEAVNRQSIMGMITRYSDRRMKYYQSLPTFKTFGAGWTNRVDQAHGAALELL